MADGVRTSAGFSGAERDSIRIADTVAVFVQRSIRLCATASANLLGGTTIVAVESLPARWEVSHRLGADHVGDFRDTDAGGRAVCHSENAAMWAARPGA